MKTSIFWTVSIFCLLQAGICSLSIAEENISRIQPDRARTYFNPNSSDGMPVRRPAGCQDTGSIKDSLFRDLGKGVSLLVIPTNDEARLVSVNLVFIYSGKGSLHLSPAQFQLHSLPNEKLFTPGRVNRQTFGPNSYDRYTEEVYIEFPTQSEKFENIELVLPSSTVSSDQGDSSALKIRPFRFSRTNQLASGTPHPEAAPCMYLANTPLNVDALLRAH